MKFVTQDYYEILNVAPEATNEQVKRAYRMVRQSFRPDSMAIHSLYSDAETEAISAKIDEAFRILSSPESARRYARYHRTGRAGMSIPKDPDAFFDSVHQLDAASPIEQLARQVGVQPPELDESQEGTADAMPLRSSVGSSPSSEDVVAQVEVFIDSLEEVEDSSPSLTLHRGGVAASSTHGAGGLQAVDRTVELLTTGPVAHPDESILAEVTAPKRPKAEQVAVQANVAVAFVEEETSSGRPMVTDTVRGQRPGPLQIEALPTEVLEAIEMNCGGINGEFMKQVRRELNISVEEIKNRTKIGMQMIMAIEAEDHSYFQARVYMKGYLRQICRLLKLPSREITERYIDTVGVE